MTSSTTTHFLINNFLCLIFYNKAQAQNEAAQYKVK